MRAAALALALCLAAAGARADWRGFYTPTPKADEVKVASDSTCLREILRAQLRHGIPGNLLLAIGLQEAGLRRDGALTVWPWTVNAEGEGRFFESAASALDWVRERQGDGVTSIDVGCMQINLRWHPDAFASPEEGFDPARNVDYAARLLKKLYAQTGDWGSAAGGYHSFTPVKQEAYLQRLSQNLEVANAQIEDFRVIAAAAGPVGRPVPDAAPMPEGGIFWSAWLGRDAAGEGARSLYSRGPIEPILPAFRAEPEVEG